jgi:predicted RNase H-like HicB family nuclease
MKQKFTAKIHREGEIFVALCPEVPEANGRGRTKNESLQNLTAAIKLIFKNRQRNSDTDDSEPLGGS